jgi:hypothetical protein
MGKPTLVNRPIARVHVVFILAGIAIGLWAYIVGPGVYYGRLNGRFLLMAEETAEFRFVTVEAESAPQWEWSRAPTFVYPLVRIRVEGGKDTKSMNVLFPGPRVNAGGKEEPLTAESFATVVAGGERGVEGQAKELYAFVEAIGQGNVQRPRHHTYYVDRPYRGSFTHFALGRPAFVFVIGAVAASWAVTATGLWLAKRRQKLTTAN